MKFHKGQVVRRAITGANGTYWDGEARVSRVDERGVWLSNGQGKKSSGPFHSRTGYLKRRRIFNMRQSISSLPPKIK